MATFALIENGSAVATQYMRKSVLISSPQPVCGARPRRCAQCGLVPSRWRSHCFSAATSLTVTCEREDENVGRGRGHRFLESSGRSGSWQPCVPDEKHPGSAATIASVLPSIHQAIAESGLMSPLSTFTFLFFFLPFTPILALISFSLAVWLIEKSMDFRVTKIWIQNFRTAT